MSKDAKNQDVLMILPRKSVRSEIGMPAGWEVDQDACGLSLTIEKEPSCLACWKQADDFGTKRPAIYFESLQDKCPDVAFEVLVSRLAKAFDEIPSRYPLYIRFKAQQLDLIATASRMGFIPYFGSWSVCSSDQSEHAWNQVTESLRRTYPDGYPSAQAVL